MTEAVAPSSQPFSARAVLLMVLVGVFAFACYVVLSTYAPDLRSGRDGRAHALSRSAAGFAGLVQLLRDCDVPVQISRGRSTDAAAMRVLTPEVGGDPKAFAAAIDPAKHPGVTLVVLPKWVFGPVLQHPGWVSKAGLVDADQAVAMFAAGDRPGIVRSDGMSGPRLTATGASPIAAGQAAIGVVDQLQTLTGAGFEPLLIDEQGRWLLASAPGRPSLVILSDPDLMNTQGLKDARRARMAVDIIEALRGQAPVVFDVSINGFEGSRSLLKLALEPPFLAATLCALIAAGLIGWQAAIRLARRGRRRALWPWARPPWPTIPPPCCGWPGASRAWPGPMPS